MKKRAAALALLIPAGCTDASSFTLGKHSFTVPAPYVEVVPVYAFWKDRPTSLTFTLDPQDPAEAQHVVNVESAEATCKPSRLAGASPLGAACAAAHARSRAAISLPLAKAGNARQWTYQAGGRTIASCYETPRGGGLCTALSNYQDVLISISFHADEAGRLPKMEAEARRLLASWDGVK